MLPTSYSQGIGVGESWGWGWKGASDAPPICLQGAPPATMRLFISLPVLIVVLAMALEGKNPGL